MGLAYLPTNFTIKSSKWTIIPYCGSYGISPFLKRCKQGKLSQYTSRTNGYPKWWALAKVTPAVGYLNLCSIYEVHHDGALLGTDHTPTYHPPWGINIIGLAKGNLVQTFKNSTKHASYVQNLHAQCFPPWWLIKFNQQPKRLWRYKSSHLWLQQSGKVSNFYVLKNPKATWAPQRTRWPTWTCAANDCHDDACLRSIWSRNSPGTHKKTSRCSLWRNIHRSDMGGAFFQHMATFRSWWIFNLFPSVRKVNLYIALDPFP